MRHSIKRQLTCIFVGLMAVVLLATVTQICVRTVCVWVLVPRVGIVGEAWGCFTGWMCQLVLELSVLVFLNRKKEEKT